MRSTTTARWLAIAMMRYRTAGRIFIAWSVAFLAYTGFWAYHTAAYGFWYHGPMPVWLNVCLSATLAVTLILTVVMWRSMKRAGRL